MILLLMLKYLKLSLTYFHKKLLLIKIYFTKSLSFQTTITYPYFPNLSTKTLTKSKPPIQAQAPNQNQNPKPSTISNPTLQINPAPNIPPADSFPLAFTKIP